MKLSGAEIIIKFLEKRGINIIPGIPGGANLPLYNALYKSKIQHILARHEQGAGFIAQGIARTTGKTAVCFATSGPGATNLITAIADAKSDSIPLVAITGQVSTSLIGTDAFQEVDTYGITLPITKHNFLVRRVNELLTVLPEAFKIAETGRPGPVVIDVPKDVQLVEIEIDDWQLNNIETPSDEIFIKDSDIQHIAEMIHKSKRPLLYIGGGIIQSNSHELVYQLAKKNSIPITSTLMGLGCIPPEEPLNLGMIGMHGARYTNMIVNEADLLIAFGVRFDDRATGNVKKFCPNASIIHVDIDKSEIDKIKKSNLSISADINKVLKLLIPHIQFDTRTDWISHIMKMKSTYPLALPKTEDPFHPHNLLKIISHLAPEDSIITTDVGQHQMWVAQAYPFRHPRTLLTSGGLGTMGFGLPVAIGAALAQPNRRVICISGDGSFLMNIQELATLADLNLNVTIIIMNNGHLGLVRQQQELFYNENYIASKFHTNPDFAAIAQNFGIKGYDPKENDDLVSILSEALTESGANLVNVPIHFAENVLPMVPPGAGNHEMIYSE